MLQNRCTRSCCYSSAAACQAEKSRRASSLKKEGARLNQDAMIAVCWLNATDINNDQFASDASWQKPGDNKISDRNGIGSYPSRSLNRRDLNTTAFGFFCGRKIFWKWSFSKTMAFPDRVFCKLKTKMAAECCAFKLLWRGADEVSVCDAFLEQRKC